MVASLTRRVRFRARHRLWLAELTQAENRTRFGRTVDSHPHDYICDVTVAGDLPASGALVDLAALDALLQEAVVQPLDGRDLNEVRPDWNAGQSLPTCEALAAWCWDRLARRLPPGVVLERIQVAEDETLWGECRRGQ